MSEYQYVAFRAIDQPVSADNLAYMQGQSSRAEITPWSFVNEYHYGGFRGNAVEMLRRGYDIHLHYANYGIRRLMIRLPQGLPDPQMLKSYLVADSLEFLADKQGPGGCLSIDPYDESGDWDNLWDVGPLLDQLAPLRAELLDGDLRPLWLAHLAVLCDSNHDPEVEREGPVPAGLTKLTPAQSALAEFYGLDQHLIAAAAAESPPLPAGASSSAAKLQREEWVGRQPVASKNAWLTALMNDPASAVRAEMLAKYRSELVAPPWPVSHPNRTVAELKAAAKVVAEQAKQDADVQAAKEREKRLRKIAESPTTTVREIETLVAKRSLKAYRQAAELLVDLRDALAGSDQADMAEKQARKLKSKYPKAHSLIRDLRERGFIPK